MMTVEASVTPPLPAHEKGNLLEEASRPRREQKKPQRLASLTDDPAFQQALKKSLSEVKRADEEVPECPVFHPTAAEFQDPMQYIATVFEEGSKAGICKIVPPEGWKPEFSYDRLMSKRLYFATKKQEIHRLTEGVGFPKGKSYMAGDYKAQSDAFAAKWFEEHPYLKEAAAQGPQALAKALEKDYWRLVETNTEKVAVEYGNDIDTRYFGSGFIKNGSSRHPWDLNGFNNSPLSVLQTLAKGVPGVTSPWLYMGMLFSSFCWHTEDHFLASVNYMHHGAPKSWYGIPSSSARRFERLLRQTVPALFSDQPGLLFHLVTQLPPSVCLANGVDVVHALQEPGHFIVTFPEAYHAGFNQGFNIAEAVNFAPLEWVAFGRRAVEEYQKGGGKRCATFPHDKLVWDLASGALAPGAGSTGWAIGAQQLEEAGFLSLAQGLHSGKEGWKMLHRDLAAAIRSERVLRKWAVEQGAKETWLPPAPTPPPPPPGASPVSPPPGPPPMGALGDKADPCMVCRTLPFLSLVRCQCSPGKACCLRHGFSQCRCPPEHRFLEVRVREEEMDRVLQQLGARVQASCGGLLSLEGEEPAGPPPSVRPKPEPQAPPPGAATAAAAAAAAEAAAAEAARAGGGAGPSAAPAVKPEAAGAGAAGAPAAAAVKPEAGAGAAGAPAAAAAAGAAAAAVGGVGGGGGGGGTRKRGRERSPDDGGVRGRVACDVCSMMMDKKRSVCCMGCDCNFHLGCCEPPLRALPPKDAIWLCSVCLRGQ